MCSLKSNLRYIFIPSDNCLAPNSQQAIIWTSDVLVYRCVYASLGLNELSWGWWWLGTHDCKEHPSVEKIRREFDKINGEFDFRPVTVDLVMQNIKNINPKKATGYDNIPGKMIKIAYRELSVPICNLMNTCIAMRTFPTPFKFADVSPIFKSDDNMNKGNFRPVSILSILSKLFESVLNEQMLDHFREIFDALLSAYRRHYSCQTVLLNSLKT